jgi:hypothetical protein
MKTVTNKPAFQGDLMIRRIDAVPTSAKVSAPEKGVHILAHSETGHHHIVASRAADMFIDEMNKFIGYLNVSDDTILKHLRDFDTHEPLLIPPGVYEVRRQREYTPEGWRRAAD